MRFAGSGPILIDSCSGLHNAAQRHAQILRVVEINSVIEGLPPFSDELRQQIETSLAATAAERQSERSAAPLAAGGNAA